MSQHSWKHSSGEIAISDHNYARNKMHIRGLMPYTWSISKKKAVWQQTDRKYKEKAYGIS